MDVVFEPLSKKHDRAGFDCGQSNLDSWLRQQASQDDKRNLARVFVAVDREHGVVGFYSLSAFGIELSDLPEALARKLPRYGLVPAALIGRLARDRRVGGKGMGGLLLADAIKRVLDASKTLSVYAIVVDAKDDASARFYRAYGFIAFPLKPSRLFLLTATAARA